MKQALRVLGREKAFAAFAVLTLALGVGAITTMFSVVDSVLLKPLAFKEPERLYAASESAPQMVAMFPRIPVNASHFKSWLEQCSACETGALANPATFNLTGSGDPERIDGATCTWRLFDVLGVSPRLGRTFLESEDRPGDNKFIVVADSFWKRRLGSDPDVVGKPIQLDGVAHIVVGVLRPDFRFPSGDQVGPLNQFPRHAEIFRPMGFDLAKARRIGQFNFASLIRLKPGYSAAQAEAEMTAAIADAARDMSTPLGAHLVPLQDQVTGGVRRAFLLLLAALGVVLLIVCVNLGNLMLVRASERVRDAAIRRALGAGAADLFRPIIAESLLLSFLGGVLGLAFAYAGIRILVAVAPVHIPRLDEVHLSLSTLVFAFVISAGCGVLCGLWPAFRATSVEPADAFRSGSRSATAGRSRLRSREWLVGLEVALSTVLLVLAALLGLSFFRVTGVERGYQIEGILTADLSLPGSRYRSDDQRALFHKNALEKLEAIPGVRSTGLVSSLPLKAQLWGDAISKQGDTRTHSARPMAHYRFVSERYFESMGIELRRGRFPISADRNHKVAIVSESAARTVWPGEDAVGKLIHNDARKDWVEVVGVVADVRTESLEKQPALIVYVPYWDGAYWQGAVWGNATYVMRTTQDPSALTGALGAAMRELDPELPIANVLTMRQITAESLSNRRFQTMLASAFAFAALLLACLGIYGVISYSVTRRTNEMGLRIALGAQSSQVSKLVLMQGAKPVIAGLLMGMIASLGLGRLISSFLFGTDPHDPAAMALVAATLAVVAVAACWVPARRAARIDPMTALREE